MSISVEALSFSLIVVYRNRDIPRVKRFLDSLSWQTNKNFELIFVDYGSEISYQEELKLLLRDFSFIKYIYVETRGLFWNRSNALNIGITNATSENIITLDVDLIFPPDFIVATSKIFLPHHYVRYGYFYLPPHYNRYEQLFNEEFKPWKYFKKTVEATNFGVLAFTKTSFINAGGYDEFYRIWGVEDIDFVKRLESIGTKSQGYAKQLHTYHQWHEKSKAKLPKGWYNQMVHYHKTVNEQQLKTYREAQVLFLDDRPALQIYINDDLKKEQTFQFTYPKEQSFVEFLYQFDQLGGNQSLMISQSFELIRDGQKTTWGRLFNYINKMFTRWGVSYRWVDLETHSTEVILKKEVSDFLFYFLITYQHEILDYYFNYQTGDKNLVLIVVKK